MLERPTNDGDEPTGQISTGLSRRALLSGLLTATGLSLLGVIPTSAEAQEQRVSKPRLIEMSDHKMPEGFTRSKILAEINGQSEVIGSVFFLEESRAKAEFITRKSSPEDFEAIQSTIRARGDTVALVAAGAFFTSAGQTKGLALQDGQMVGEAQATDSLNGMLVIKNGVPSIEYLNQISDFQAFLAQAKKEGWDLFQQTSYIRPGGTFQSSNPNAYELRFFVEGEGKKAVVNFTEKMTYTEAVQALEQLAGFQIEKAIGLDTGTVSEGRFFDREGNACTMLDEQFGKGKGYTNLLVLFSDL